jgi:hypothetical protein
VIAFANNEAPASTGAFFTIVLVDDELWNFQIAATETA